MSSVKGKFAVVISKIPMVQMGLGCMMARHFPEYEATYCRTQDELTSLQVKRAAVVIADISGEYFNPRGVLEQYYLLMSQYKGIHWIFLISRPLYPLAIELLMCPQSTLLSDMGPVEGVISALRAGRERAERISQALLLPEPQALNKEPEQVVTLTLSERQVLRLLGKGWGINQIASLLNKSNKTISAQKNSAMRRLSLHGNAEMYSWINSSQGMRELNLISAYGEPKEWKHIPQEDTLQS